MKALLPDPNPVEVRGKHIYLSGTSISGAPITATLGGDDNPIPGSAFACVNCHGRNGQGRPEGGIIPSDIRWSTLTKPYELILSEGRKRGPYTEQSLKRAIALGVDSSNNALSAAMPHFQITDNDVADLIAYLKILGTDNDPGISDDRLRIGVILPPRRMTEMHQSVKSALDTYFRKINTQGGIFGRQIELEFLDYPEDAEARAQTVRDFLVNKNIFALTSSFIAGDEAALTPIFQQTETPVLAGFALYPQATPNPFVFYLDEGVFGQVKALIAFVARQLKKAAGNPVVVYSDTAPSRQLAEAVDEQCQSLGLKKPHRVLIQNADFLTIEQAKEIYRADDSFVVMLLEPSMVLRGLHGNGETNLKTLFLIPGSLLPNNIFFSTSAMGMNIFVAGVPPWRSENAATEQWSALAAANIMMEGLKRAGRDLSREAFIKSLESLSNFDDGFAQPITYGSNQHVGNTQSRIMFVDIENRRFTVMR